MAGDVVRRLREQLQQAVSDDQTDPDGQEPDDQEQPGEDAVDRSQGYGSGQPKETLAGQVAETFEILLRRGG